MNTKVIRLLLIVVMAATFVLPRQALAQTNGEAPGKSWMSQNLPLVFSSAFIALAFGVGLKAAISKKKESTQTHWKDLKQIDQISRDQKLATEKPTLVP